METESGAKIAIRGKGSVKEGKGRSDAAHTSNQEEDLHCLIMADTEEKVNKAKKLIHNVIETVSFPFHHLSAISNTNRLHPSQKAKTSSSATNYVNSPLSTVPFVTMKTKLARIVVKLGTASTTAPSSATSPPISSVVSVAMLVTWLEIVRIDSAVQIGVTMALLVLAVHLALQLVTLVLEMLLTASTR
jgi:hypothetical protein